MLKEFIGLLAAAGTGGLIYAISSSFNVSSYPTSFIEKSLAPSPVRYLSRDVKLTHLDHYKFGEVNNGGCKLGLANSKSDHTGGTLDGARNEVLIANLKNSSESKGTKLKSLLYGTDNESTKAKTQCQERGKQTPDDKKYLELSGIDNEDTGKVSTDDGPEHKPAHARLAS